MVNLLLISGIEMGSFHGPNSYTKLKLGQAQDLYRVDFNFIMFLHLPLLNVGMFISGLMTWLLSLMLYFSLAGVDKLLVPMRNHEIFIIIA